MYLYKYLMSSLSQLEGFEIDCSLMSKENFHTATVNLLQFFQTLLIIVEGAFEKTSVSCQADLFLRLLCRAECAGHASSTG